METKSILLDDKYKDMVPGFKAILKSVANNLRETVIMDPNAGILYKNIRYLYISRSEKIGVISFIPIPTQPETKQIKLGQLYPNAIPTFSCGGVGYAVIDYINLEYTDPSDIIAIFNIVNAKTKERSGKEMSYAAAYSENTRRELSTNKAFKALEIFSHWASNEAIYAVDVYDYIHPKLEGDFENG